MTNGWKKPPFANWHIHIGHAAHEARKNKKMLLIFTTRSLAAPEYLSRDANFRKWLEERFVLVFCDCDYLDMPQSQKQHLETFFRLLKIEIAPSTVVLGYDGKYLAYIPGHRNLQPALYRTILNEVCLGKKVHFDRNYNYLYSSEK
jgi:thioredoxin-related protein